MTKYRIGILGTENSHADAFCGIFNKAGENGEYAYPDFRVTYVYGNYAEASENLAKKYDGIKIAESVAEMVKNVDAVMVTARDGKYHAAFAKPFIEAGIPAFIDKPFTRDVKEAAELIRIAREKKVPLCGGSSLKYSREIAELKKFAAEKGVKGGFISAPVSFKNEYGDFWFYSSHLAEMCMEVFGWKPKAVYATENNESVFAVVDYENFSVTCDFINHGFTAYAGAVFGADGSLLKTVGLEGVEKAETDEFVKMVRTGETVYGYDELAAPVFLLESIIKSYKTGKKINTEL